MIPKPLTDLEVLEDKGHILVRSAMQRDGEVRDAIINIASAHKAEWGVAEWDTLLTGLDRCNLKVSTWLKRIE